MDFITILKKLKPDWVPPSILIALDPGITTGYAVFIGGRIHLTGTMDWEDPKRGVNQLYYLFERFFPNILVCEDYRLYASKAKAQIGSQMKTVKIIGAIELICSQQDIKIVKQMAVTGKGFVTDDRLKEWGMYDKVNRHARDAVRHGCHWILFNKEEKCQQ